MNEKVLISTLGEAPEVVTEVLDKLLQKGEQISKVIVVTTSSKSIQDGRYMYIMKPEPSNRGIEVVKVHRVWSKGTKDTTQPLLPCWDVQKGNDYVSNAQKKNLEAEFQTHPEYKCNKVNFDPISVQHEDIENLQENNEFSRKLFEIILNEKLAGNEIYINVAGGRKTMAAYAFFGGLLFGAKGIYHVLVDKDSEDNLLKGGEFHLPGSITPPSYYHLIEILPNFNLPEFFTERLSIAKDLSREFQEKKIMLDIVQKLAKNEGLSSNFIRHESIFPPLEAQIRNKVIEDLKNEMISRKDCIPSPWYWVVVSSQEKDKNKWWFVEALRKNGTLRVEWLNNKNIGDKDKEDILDGLNQHHDMDVVVLDFPGEEVPEGIIAAIRDRYPLLPIIYLSGTQDVSSTVAATRAGATFCLDPTGIYQIPLCMDALFQPSLPSQGQVVKVNEEEIQPAGDLWRLVGLLFPLRGGTIELSSFSEGAGGAEKYWVEPSGQKVAKELMKVGPKLELVEERMNYKNFVQGFLDNAAGRIEREAAVIGQKAAISYTAVGLPHEYGEGHKPESLKDCLLKISSWAEKLFEPGTGILDVWYSKGTKKSFDPYQDYGWVLPPKWTVAFEGFDAVDSRDGNHGVVDLSNSSFRETDLSLGEVYRFRNGRLQEIKMEGDTGVIQLSHPNFGLKVKVEDIPKCYLGSPKLHHSRTIHVKGKIKRVLELWFKEKIKEVDGCEEQMAEELISYLNGVFRQLDWGDKKSKKSIIHGDLNLTNILVDERKNLWLIDFAKTKYGPTVYDFVKLETEIKIHRLVGELNTSISIAELKGMEASFPKTRSRQGSREGAGSFDGRPAYLEMIEEIRRRGLEHAQDPPWDYFLALFIYSLSALKFNLGIPAKKFLVASAMASLETLGDNLNSGR